MKTNHHLSSPYSRINPAGRRSASILVLVALVSVSACQTSHDLSSGDSAKSRFDTADANHDGKLSRYEASDFLVNTVFDSRDANHDGRMSPEEWGAMDDPAQMKDFKKRDANDDEIVTKEEALAYGRAHGMANKIVNEADKNHDGSLDRDEVQAYYASREGPAR